MILKQFYLNCLAHASYLIGDEQTRAAAIVDPQRDVDQYLTFAAEHGLRIEHVFLTHFHADFIAGHLELRDRVGAKIYLGAAAKAEYAFTPLHDRDIVDLGRVRLQALETPQYLTERLDSNTDQLANNPNAFNNPSNLFLDYSQNLWSWGAFAGFVVTVVASMIVERTARGDEMFVAMARRHARHALDLGAADLLG